MRRILISAVLLPWCAGCLGDAKLAVEHPSTPPVTDEAACEQLDVGVTPLRRLTRDQYDHLADDLLKASFLPSAALPNDEKVGPFASNGGTLVTRSLIEQYGFVAGKLGEEIAARVQTVAPCADATNGAAACAQTFIDDFGRRAFRRALTSEESQRWQALFVKTSTGADYATGIRSVVEGMLQSAAFLYHLEPVPEGVALDAPSYDVDGWTTAERLSFLLWNSGPDKALLDAAAAGKLSTQEEIVAQAKRMLQDPRAARGTQAFTSGWLGLSAVGEAAASADGLRGLTPATVGNMEEETLSFVDTVLRKDDGKLSTLFTAPWSVARPDVLELYGAAPVYDAQGRAALNPAERAGVLTQASVLFAHSHAQVTSPVLRGKWVREALLCQKIPDPPPNVMATPPTPTPGQTTRQRFEAHRSDPVCASCHAMLDDVGFAFEKYDQTGRLRSTDQGLPIDDSGKLTATDVNGTFVGAVELAAKLSTSEVASACYSTQWLRFGLGRAESSADECLLKQLRKAEGEGGYPALVEQLVSSKALHTRRVQ